MAKIDGLTEAEVTFYNKETGDVVLRTNMIVTDSCITKNRTIYSTEKLKELVDNDEKND